MIPSIPKQGTYQLMSTNGLAYWKQVDPPNPPNPPNPPTTTPKYLYIIAGQSNTGTNNGPIIPGIDNVHPRIFQYSRGLKNKYYNPGQKGDWIVAQHPLQHPFIPDPSVVGFGLSFAKKKLESLEPNAEIYLLCSGTGGSGFRPSDMGYGEVSWRKSFIGGLSNLYNDMIKDAKNALTNTPGLKVGGMLWQQGESDLGNFQYEYDINKFVQNFRQDLGDYNIQFICGTMLKSWKDSTLPQSSYIDNIHKTVPNKIWLGGCCIFDDLTGAFDTVHYNAVSQRIMGERYTIESNKIDEVEKKAYEEWKKQHPNQ